MYKSDEDVQGKMNYSHLKQEPEFKENENSKVEILQVFR